MLMGQKYFCAMVSFLVICALAIGCKRKSNASSKSFLALNARVAAGEAPSFVAVAQWFEGATNSASNAGDEALHLAPPQLRDGLIRYVLQQVQRTADLQRSITTPAAIEQLLDVETQEMKDIVLALIQPGYLPATNDLFAALLTQPGIRDYVDAASLPALSQIMMRPMDDLLGNMERERLNYLDALKKQYLSTAGATEKLGQDLDRNCSWLRAFLVQVNVNLGADACFAGGSAAQGQASGAVPRFMSLFSGLMRAQQFNEPNGPNAPGGFGGLPPGGFPPGGGMTQGQISPDAPNLSVFNGVVPPSQLGRGSDYVSPGGSRSGNTSGGDGSEVFDQCPEGFVFANGGCEASGDSGSYALDDWPGQGPQAQADESGFLSLFFDKANHSSSPKSSAKNFSRPRYIENPGRPRVDCAARGLRGMRLVNCQRYIAYLPNFREMRVQNKAAFAPKQNRDGSPPSQGGTRLNLNQPGQKQLDLLLYSPFPSPVQNQGSEGACTAFGMTHTVITNMRKFDPGYTFDAWDLWSRYSNPYMSAAIDAAGQGPLGRAVVGNTQELNGIDEMLAELDAGKAIFARSAVDSSWQNASSGSATLTCENGRGGHAYSIQGYLRDQGAPGGGYFVVKNSWGRWFGDDGYGYQPFACATGSGAEAFRVEVSPGGA